jgi:ABC-type bacteriocin/lantibiotic exporter with double-glycine peptidase domain
MNGDVELKKVDFVYASRPDAPVLQNIDLKVDSGKVIALVGQVCFLPIILSFLNLS